MNNQTTKERILDAAEDVFCSSCAHHVNNYGNCKA